MHTPAKKSLGQNFLRDHLVEEKIFSTVRPLSGEIILEIGPGEGVLTERLALSGAHVIAVELDDRLIPFLKKKFEHCANVSIVHQDILKLHVSQEIETHRPQSSEDNFVRSDYRVVGNLPYYITSAIIRKFLELEHSPKEMFFMVQKEVGERIVSKAGDMSILSVSVQYYGVPELLFTVPKEAFEPMPNVESCFLSIKRKEIIDRKNEEFFFRTVKIGFSSKRKKLVNTLSAGFQLERGAVHAILAKVNLKENVRAQELSMEDWMRVSLLIKEMLSL